MKEYLHEEKQKEHCWRLKDHFSRNRILFDENRSGNAFIIQVYSIPQEAVVKSHPPENEQEAGRLRPNF
ncbi:MAG TPA: hypothetical protein VM843_07455 [Flavisolibacter sp.]|nr:hypothetical protein [Flavisolibacter sp.]